MKNILSSRNSSSAIILIPVLILAPAYGRISDYDGLVHIFSGSSAYGQVLASTVQFGWNSYHNYSEVVNALMLLNQSYPSLVKLFSIGESWQNRTIYCVRLTNENLTSLKPKTLFVGYHHAREIVSAELPLYFVLWATESYGIDEEITRILNMSEIYVVVALNVDGLQLIGANDWQRKNARPTDDDGDGLTDEDPPDDENGDGRIAVLDNEEGESLRWEGIDNDHDGRLNEDWIGGVDLNRNYGYAWNVSAQSGSDIPQQEDYRGPYPFSEPETRALMNLMLESDFKYAVSFHSGTEAILYPWSYKDEPTLDDAEFRNLAENLSQIIDAPSGQAGSGLYTSSGTWDDWAYANRSVMTLTCEIYENGSAWQNSPGPQPGTYWLSGILEAFNPAAGELHSVILKWLPVFTCVANRAIEKAALLRDIAVTSFTISPNEAYKGWLVDINLTIKNLGSQTEAFNVTIGYDNHTLVTAANCEAPPNSETNINLTLDTNDLTPCNTYLLWAEASALPDEINPSNNRFSSVALKIKLPGDVNGDGTVNIVDIALIAIHFGNWYRPFDLNRDGIIDLLDIATAARNFGKSCKR